MCIIYKKFKKMKSILGIVKDIGPLNEMVHGADLKTINYKHFIVVNLVLNIANSEKIKRVEFILLNNLKKMSNQAVKNFLDQYDLIVQYSNKNENSEEYISKNKNRFIFIESPIVYRYVNKPLLSQKYLRVMSGDHLGNNFIKKYNQNFIRKNFEFPVISKKNNNGTSFLLINQMVNDSAIKPTNPYNWALKTIEKIRTFSKNDIIFRDHPLQRNVYKSEIQNILDNEKVYLSNNLDIESDLNKSKCCITFSSGSAVESLFLGVPVIAMDKRSFVYEIVENNIDMMEKLKMPNLDKLKSSLSHTHFSVNEILDGTCWNNIKKIL